MSKVERYWIEPSRLVQEGWHPDDTCVVKDWAYDRVVAERDGLHVSLNTADQTIDDLNAAVSRRTKRIRELEAQLAYAVDALNEVVKASAMYEKPFEIATLAIGEMSAGIEQSAPVAVAMPERLQQVLKFLEGAENLDGHWFGEPGPTGQIYWWRNELRKALAETNLFANQQ